MAFAALAIATASAFAAPIEKAHVPASPHWAVHLDCDKLKSTVLGQHVLAEMNKPEAQEKLAAFSTIFNFDPRKQLHGVTLYGTSTKPEDGILLVYADVDTARLETLVSGAKDHHVTPHKKGKIHNWLDDNKVGKDGNPQRTFAATYSSNIIAFGQSEAQVGLALDVLTKQTPALDTSTSWPFQSTDADFLQAYTRKLELPESDPSAAVLRLTKTVRFQLGESGGNAKAVLVLSAETPEVASQISTIANGLLALLKFQKGKPEVTQLAESLTLKQDAEKLVVTLSLPAKDLIQIQVPSEANKAAKPN